LVGKWVIDAWTKLKEVSKCAQGAMDAGTHFPFSAKEVDARHKDAVTANKMTSRVRASKSAEAVAEDTAVGVVA